LIRYLLTNKLYRVVDYLRISASVFRECLKNIFKISASAVHHRSRFTLRSRVTITRSSFFGINFRFVAQNTGKIVIERDFPSTSCGHHLPLTTFFVLKIN
jgi:hypothetical protein